MLTDEEREELVEEIILAHATDVEFLSVVEMSEDRYPDRVEHEDQLAIYDMIHSAVITVDLDG